MPPDGRAAVAAERGRLSSSPMRDVLYPLLAVDFLQAVFALRAFQRARAGRRAGAPSYARYSFGRGLLALMGALVLAVPVDPWARERAVGGGGPCACVGAGGVCTPGGPIGAQTARGRSSGPPAGDPLKTLQQKVTGRRGELDALYPLLTRPLRLHRHPRLRRHRQRSRRDRRRRSCPHRRIRTAVRAERTAPG